MKLAIHHCPGSFSDRWIAYCEKEKITYKIVNCYNNNIIEHIKDCDALLWHHHHANYKDTLFAKSLLFSLEQAGINVFPDFYTGWHFDDKVGQKYLLEAIDAPLVPSYVFYDKESAKEFIRQTTFPKVFKLRGGAGAQNVELVKNQKEALKKIHIAFGKGFSQYNRWGSLRERLRRFKNKQADLNHVLKGVGRLFIPTEFAKIHSREKGYVYFQEFIENEGFDLRIVVIGDKAFAVKRGVRKGDFRASGSGEKEELNNHTINKPSLIKAFETAKKLNIQCLAFDFVIDKNSHEPLIVEISYGSPATWYDNCPGYWDSDLNWHKGQFVPQEWMVEDLVKQCEFKRNLGCRNF